LELIPIPNCQVQHLINRMAALLLPIAFIFSQVSLLSQALRAAEDESESFSEDDLDELGTVSLLQLRTTSLSRRWDFISGVVSRDFADQCETTLPLLGGQSDNDLKELCSEAFSGQSCDSAFQLLGGRPWTAQAIDDACQELRSELGRTTAALLDRGSASVKLHMKADANHASGLEATLKRKGWEDQNVVAQPPYYMDMFDCKQMVLWVPEDEATDGTVHYVLNYTNVTLFLNASYAEEVDAYLNESRSPELPTVPYEVQKDLDLSWQERGQIIEENTVVSTVDTPYEGIEDLGFKLYVTNCSLKPNYSIPLAPQIVPVTNASIKNVDFEDPSQYLANSSSMNITIEEINNTATLKDTQPSNTNDTVSLLRCDEDVQVEQCMGLKLYSKESITWQECQAACCKDVTCEVWQFNLAPLACYMGVPNKCEGGAIWQIWDYGGRKKSLLSTQIPKVEQSSELVDTNSTSNTTGGVSSDTKKCVIG